MAKQQLILINVNQAIKDTNELVPPAFHKCWLIILLWSTGVKNGKRKFCFLFSKNVEQLKVT